MRQPYSPEDIEKIFNDLRIVLEECKAFHETYQPCSENIAVQLFELREIMRAINAEMERMRKAVLLQ